MTKIRSFRLLPLLAPVALALAAGAAAPPASADEGEMSLKDKAAWEANTKLVEEKARTVSEQCGTKIDAVIDIASYKGWDPARLAPTEMCRAGIVSVGQLCSTALGKSTVQRSISSITCRRSNDPQSGARLSHSGTNLLIQIEPTKAYVTGKKGTTSWAYALGETLPSQPLLGQTIAGADASAMSLEERQAWESNMKIVEEKARDASEKCETKITASIDIASYKGWDPARLAPTQMCRDGIMTVAALCGTAAGRSRVQKSVSTITCRRSSDPANGARLSHGGKALLISIEPTKAYVTGKKGTTSWAYALEEVL